MAVSVVIPALNEESALPATLAAVARQGPREIVVADGGSSDATREVAAAAARVVIGARGRAAQMNLGAAAATGDVLLFLHADCVLADGALAEAERLLRRPGVVAGCFTMAVPDPHPLFRSIAAAATLRVRLAGVAYGDQGLFLRRELFEALGGFPALRFMEDVAMSLRLRKRGRIVVARSLILASPRRWRKAGIVRQTLRNWTLTALAAAGVHPDRLAKFYPDVRCRSHG